MLVHVQEVTAYQQPEFFGCFDTVLFGEHVHRVPLGIRGDDVGVVAVQIILLREEPQVGVDFVLANRVQGTVAVHVKEFDVVFAVAVVAEVVFFAVDVVQTAVWRFCGGAGFAVAVAVGSGNIGIV